MPADPGIDNSRVLRVALFTAAMLIAQLTVPVGSAQSTRGGDDIPDFSGVWVGGGGGGRGGARGGAPGRGGRGGPGGRGGRGGPQPTAQAQQAIESYDLLLDDPAYECSPASISRAWANPTPTEIEQQEDRVILRHEYMDVVRTVYLDAGDRPADAEPNVVGHSTGRYDGSTLVIETTGFSPSVISTVSGLPQTETLRTVERLTLSDDGQTFQHELTHEDPATLVAPWTSTRTLRRAPELTLLAFDCVLEDADYTEEARDEDN